MSLSCDHDSTRASLTAFAMGTDGHALQNDGDGGWLLIGQCRAPSCRSTLAVLIDLARGSIVRGSIDTEESERLAKEYIR